MMDRAAAASPQADQSDIFDPCDADMVMTGVDCYDYLGVGLHSTRCVAVDSGYCRWPVSSFVEIRDQEGDCFLAVLVHALHAYLVHPLYGALPSVGFGDHWSHFFVALLVHALDRMCSLVDPPDRKWDHFVAQLVLALYTLVATDIAYEPPRRVAVRFVVDP
jgi:hypothetical protein